MDLTALSRALDLSEKELLAHLPHVAKTLAARKGRLALQPARCSDCGFEFRERRRISPPGRCPRCKGSRIEGPWYQALG